MDPTERKAVPLRNPPAPRRFPIIQLRIPDLRGVGGRRSAGCLPHWQSSSRTHSVMCRAATSSGSSPPGAGTVGDRTVRVAVVPIGTITIPKTPAEESRKTGVRVAVPLSALPETVIVAEADTYLHAECRSRRGFVDDLECRLDASGGLIHVRSASRICLIWDLGVNRKRVETLRNLRAGGARESP